MKYHLTDSRNTHPLLTQALSAIGIWIAMLSLLLAVLVAGLALLSALLAWDYHKLVRLFVALAILAAGGVVDRICQGLGAWWEHRVGPRWTPDYKPSKKFDHSTWLPACTLWLGIGLCCAAMYSWSVAATPVMKPNPPILSIPLSDVPKQPVR